MRTSLSLALVFAWSSLAGLPAPALRPGDRQRSPAWSPTTAAP